LGEGDARGEGLLGAEALGSREAVGK
jgi:hypothetical protein